MHSDEEGVEFRQALRAILEPGTPLYHMFYDKVVPGFGQRAYAAVEAVEKARADVFPIPCFAATDRSQIRQNPRVHQLIRGKIQIGRVHLPLQGPA
jgi:hypothetical protein